MIPHEMFRRKQKTTATPHMQSQVEVWHYGGRSANTLQKAMNSKQTFSGCPLPLPRIADSELKSEPTFQLSAKLAPSPAGFALCDGLGSWVFIGVQGFPRRIRQCSHRQNFLTLRWATPGRRRTILGKKHIAWKVPETWWNLVELHAG